MSGPDRLAFDLVASRGGTLLRLRVQPGARKTVIVGSHGGALKVAVHAAPEKGKANDKVVDLVAAALEIPPSCIEVVRGHTSRDKTVWVPLPPGEVGSRLRGAQRDS